VHPALGDEPRRLWERAGGDRVVDRLVRGAVLAVPLVRPAVQLRDELGVAALALHAQDLREQVVEAEPPAAIVEGEEEEVRPR